MFTKVTSYLLRLSDAIIEAKEEVSDDSLTYLQDIARQESVTDA